MRTTQENILLLRRHGYSQTRIADELGITQPMVSRWESGEVPSAAEISLKLDRLAATVEQTEKAA